MADAKDSDGSENNRHHVDKSFRDSCKIKGNACKHHYSVSKMDQVEQNFNRCRRASL